VDDSLDDPIVELQAATIIEMNATIEQLRRQVREQDREVTRLRALVDYYLESRPVRFATFLQNTREVIRGRVRGTRR
jgi:hypothetical protein